MFSRLSYQYFQFWLVPLSSLISEKYFGCYIFYSSSLLLIVGHHHDIWFYVCFYILLCLWCHLEIGFRTYLSLARFLFTPFSHLYPYLFLPYFPDNCLWCLNCYTSTNPGTLNHSLNVTKPMKSPVLHASLYAVQIQFSSEVIITIFGLMFVFTCWYVFDII